MRIIINICAKNFSRDKNGRTCLAGFMEPLYWDSAQRKWCGVFSGGATDFPYVADSNMSRGTYLDLMEEVAMVDGRPLLELSAALCIGARPPDIDGGNQKELNIKINEN